MRFRGSLDPPLPGGSPGVVFQERMLLLALRNRLRVSSCLLAGDSLPLVTYSCGNRLKNLPPLLSPISTQIQPLTKVLSVVPELGDFGTISFVRRHVCTYTESMGASSLIAIYARVSTLTRGQDVENQLAQLREFARKMGWSIVKEYIDHASGGKNDRRAFQQLFSDAAQRRFDLVLFWSLDRFSREGTLQTLQHLQRLTSYGCGWRSFTESYLDSLGPFADVVISLLSTIAKQERIRISERVAAGLVRAAAKGRFPGRPQVKCDRDKVLALRATGHSFSQIAKEMSLAKATVARLCKQTAPSQVTQ